MGRTNDNGNTNRSGNWQNGVSWETYKPADLNTSSFHIEVSLGGHTKLAGPDITRFDIRHTLTRDRMQIKVLMDRSVRCERLGLQTTLTFR